MKEDLTEYEEWYLGLLHIFADFVIYGGGSYSSSVMDLMKWSVHRMGEE